MLIVHLAIQVDMSVLGWILPSAGITPMSNRRTTGAPPDRPLRHHDCLSTPHPLVRSPPPGSSCRCQATRIHSRIAPAPKLQLPLFSVTGSKGPSSAHHRLRHLLLNTVVMSAGLGNHRNHLGIEPQSCRPRCWRPFPVSSVPFSLRLSDLDPSANNRSLSESVPVDPGHSNAL
jgi:hypothetical protein